MKRDLKRLGAFTLAVSMSLSIIPTTSLSAAAYSSDYGDYKSRFEVMYEKLKNTSNGYFSPDGVPYHSIETLMVETPDYGHLTTSEAFSYYMWLEAVNGKLSGDFSGFKKAWDTAEEYIIPSSKDQPNSAMDSYNPNKPAIYAPEWPEISDYPANPDTGAPVGKDPIAAQLNSAYGNNMIYGMHWLLDVDNWYGFGNRGDGISKNSYINTFERGEQESTWETIPHPCWDEMKFGGSNGYINLFTGDNSYSKQFRYTNAPDADARAIQATYWANEWAKDKGIDIKSYVNKAAKMGDYLRYAMFDKYFRKVGSPSTAGTGYDSCMWLLSSQYSWGGGVDADWSWRIGSSHNQFGYQNPLTAWVLSTQSNFKPKAENAVNDWTKSLDRQIDFYQWLQSDEGAIADGASNSYNGRYEEWPSDTAIFYGMRYDENPVHKDPESNTWFGMQTRSMQRMAEYYYQTGDQRVKKLLNKWVKWAISTVQFYSDGTFRIPNKINWDGQPDTWTGEYTGNPNLHVVVTEYGTDLGVASSLANTLTFYAKASGDQESAYMAKKLLDTLWINYQDEKGISAPEARNDYIRFEQEVYVPLGFSGNTPNGEVIRPGIKFIDIRSKYRQDPDWPKIEKYLASYNETDVPTMRYHRFWAQSEFAVANGIYAILNPSPYYGKGDVNLDSSIDAIDLSLMKMYLLNSSTAINKENADIYYDGNIDALDYAKLKLYLLTGKW